MTARDFGSIVFLAGLMLNCVANRSIEMIRLGSDNSSSHELIAADSFLFGKPVLNFCRERNSVLVLDANLERIFKFDLNDFQSIETISLPQKINFLNGIASDNVYIYLYSENSLFRFDRTKGEIQSLIKGQDRIRIADLTITQQGEIFVSDDLNNRIVYINTLGRMQTFDLSPQSLFIPSGIYFDNTHNRLWLINRTQQQIEAYLRNGYIDRIVKLPNAYFNRIFASKPDIFVFDKMHSQISRIENESMIDFFIPGQKNILNFLIADRVMLILRANGVYLFKVTK